MEDAENPETGSLNDVTKGMGEAFVGSVPGELSRTAGATLSNVRWNCAASALLLPAASHAAPAGMFTVRTPCASGMRLKAYASPEPEKSATCPLHTRMLAASKPETGLLNVTVTGMGE